MNLHAKSLRSQWIRWAILFLAGVVAYAIALHLIGSETSAWLILARQNVAAFAAASFVFGWLAYEFRWDGMIWEEEGEGEGEGEGVGEGEGEGEGRGGGVGEGEGRGGGRGGGVGGGRISPTPAPTPTEPQPGEAEWLEAQQLLQRTADPRFMTLVKRSAELDYAPALAQLGDCALDRQAFAEAYYWYFRARKQGMRNLDSRLRGIRQDWQRAGFPNPRNWYLLQDGTSRSISCALLDRDAGRNAKAATEFLSSVGFV